MFISKNRYLNIPIFHLLISHFFASYLRFLNLLYIYILAKKIVFKRNFLIIFIKKRLLFVLFPIDYFFLKIGGTPILYFINFLKKTTTKTVVVFVLKGFK
jgi:hypothetical protein